jgi:hypothetical protein
MHFRFRAFLIIVALVAAIGPFVMSRSVLAQDTATITVSAEITNGLSLTTCDTTVDFGSGLTAFGSAPFGSNEVVTISQPGEPSLGEGVIYVWRPPCDGSGALFRVNATEPYRLTSCATENGGTAGPVVGNRVLEWYFGYELDINPAYTVANGGNPFNLDCQSTNFGIVDGSVADYPIPIRYLLRVDQSQQTGTIDLATTWTLSI